MPDFIPDTPDRPITWTLASESQIKKLPSLEQMWAEWREAQAESEQWKESVGYYRTGMASSRVNIDTDKVNAYHEQQLLNKENE